MMFRRLGILGAALLVLLSTNLYAAPITIDTSSRTAVITAYNTIYKPAFSVATGWSGADLTSPGCNPGTTSLAHQQATIDTANFYRAMAGLPSANLLSSTSHPDVVKRARAAALYMAVNHTLTHSPPNSGTCWSQDAYDGASSSNLALGWGSGPGGASALITGPAAIDGYINDDGNEGTLGHRRWILYTRQVGFATGDIPNPASSSYSSNALRVMAAGGESSTLYQGAAAPAWVAWPSPGFVPYQMITRTTTPATAAGFWSISYPGANFTAASVAMTTSGGTNVPLNTSTLPLGYKALPNGYGDNTLLFEPGLSAFAANMADESYKIVVSGITGAPSSSYCYTVTVFDTTHTGSATAPDLCNIAATVPSITTPAGALPNGTIGATYSTALASSDATATWSLINGTTLPAGLSLSAAGVISGMPAGPTGMTSFDVIARNSAGDSTPVTFNITIDPAWATVPVITAATLPDGTIGTAYVGATLAADDPGASWKLDSGSSLPAGLTLNATTGAISGMPTGPTTGLISFDVIAYNSIGDSVAETFTITIHPEPVPPVITTAAGALPGGTIGLVYAGAMLASDDPAATWALASGSLPTGLALNPTTGAITGTPAGPAGVYNFSVMAKDNAGFSAPVAFNITIKAAPAITTTAGALPDGAIGTVYVGATLTSSDPTATWAVTGGALPAGLSLNPATGAITGTPTGPAGTDNFTVTATNSVGGSSAPVAFTIEIKPMALAEPVITAVSLPDGTIGIAYIVALTSDDSAATWTLDSGSLPPGLSLSPTGVIYGTPLGPVGTSSFTVIATNGYGSSLPESFNITIKAGGGGGGATQGIPALNPAMLVLLAVFTLLLGGAGYFQNRRKN